MYGRDFSSGPAPAALGWAVAVGGWYCRRHLVVGYDSQIWRALAACNLDSCAALRSELTAAADGRCASDWNLCSSRPYGLSVGNVATALRRRSNHGGGLFGTAGSG